MDERARQIAATPTGSAIGRLRAPPGFKISLFALLPGARSITRADDGTLFVGTGGFANPKTVVYRLKDWNHDGKVAPDEIDTPITGAKNPNGVAFRDGKLYVADIDRILVYTGLPGLMYGYPAATPAVLPQRFPNEGGHGWKYIRFAPAPDDKWLYIAVGANCNTCKVLPPFGAVYRVNVLGTERETVATGIRNTVGFDFDPVTKHFLFTDNGRDGWGDDRPPDELNEISPGKDPSSHFGFPYCYGKKLRDDSIAFDKKVKSCESTVKPVVELGAHVAALGMRFYRGSMFPAEYRNQIFIAEHGSWNRSKKSGYRVTAAKRTGSRWEYQPIVTGWLDEATQAHYGRPVDVHELPDGSLLISDDGSGEDPHLDGALYRLEYSSER